MLLRAEAFPAKKKKWSEGLYTFCRTAMTSLREGMENHGISSVPAYMSFSQINELLYMRTQIGMYTDNSEKF